jgi:hypothetical protein
MTMPSRLPIDPYDAAIVRAAMRGLAPLLPPQRRELLLADLDATEAALHAAEARELADRAAAVAAAAARVARALRT